MKWKPNHHSHLTVQEQIIDWIKSRIELCITNYYLNHPPRL